MHQYSLYYIHTEIKADIFVEVCPPPHSIICSPTVLLSRPRCLSAYGPGILNLSVRSILLLLSLLFPPWTCLTAFLFWSCIPTIHFLPDLCSNLPNFLPNFFWVILKLLTRSSHQLRCPLGTAQASKPFSSKWLLLQPQPRVSWQFERYSKRQ